MLLAAGSVRSACNASDRATKLFAEPPAGRLSLRLNR
jgi:hypothetical protein